MPEKTRRRRLHERVGLAHEIVPGGASGQGLAQAQRVKGLGQLTDDEIDQAIDEDRDILDELAKL